MSLRGDNRALRFAIADIGQLEQSLLDFQGAWPETRELWSGNLGQNYRLLLQKCTNLAVYYYWILMSASSFSLSLCGLLNGVRWTNLGDINLL